MSDLRLVLVGAAGRMGRMLTQVIPDTLGLRLVAALEGETAPTLGADQKRPARGNAQTVPGAQEGNPESKRRRSPARNSNGARPADPAGRGTGAHAALGPYILRVQLRVQARTVGTNGDRTGAEIRGGRLHACRGHRPVEVL